MQKKTLEKIEQVNNLIKEYGAMTLRQIYYQLVTKGYKYRQIKYVCKVGRIKGLIPADSIVDRARPCYGETRRFSNLEEFASGLYIMMYLLREELRRRLE